MIQRVKRGSVEIAGEITAKIHQGLVVFFGVSEEDSPEKSAWLAEKLVRMRLFSDDAGKMNLSVEDIKGEILIVSQFTLYANCEKGRRPSFTEAAPPEHAIPIYEKFIDEVRALHPHVKTGEFRADMQVFIENDGPVTILLEN